MYSYLPTQFNTRTHHNPRSTPRTIQRTIHTDRHPRTLDPTLPKAAAQNEKTPAPPQRTTVCDAEITLRQFSSYTCIANLHPCYAPLAASHIPRATVSTDKLPSSPRPRLRLTLYPQPTHLTLNRASAHILSLKQSRSTSLAQAPQNFRPCPSHPHPCKYFPLINRFTAPIQHISPISQQPELALR